jgi:hypothetical protein
VRRVARFRALIEPVVIVEARRPVRAPIDGSTRYFRSLGGTLVELTVSLDAFLLQIGRFLFGQKFPAAERLGPFQGGDCAEIPRALQIGFVPRRPWCWSLRSGACERAAHEHDGRGTENNEPSTVHLPLL